MFKHLYRITRWSRQELETTHRPTKVPYEPPRPHYLYYYSNGVPDFSKIFNLNLETDVKYLGIVNEMDTLD